MIIARARTVETWRRIVPNNAKDKEEDGDRAQDNMDQTENNPYNPNRAIPDSNDFGDYCERLLEELKRANRLAFKVEEEQLQDVVARIKRQHAKWDALDEVEKVHPLPHELAPYLLAVSHGALTVDEWTTFWAGLGGWLRTRQKKEAERRFAFEMKVPVPLDQGRWTRMNLVYARRSLVGPTGNRGDMVILPTAQEAEGWSARGKLNLAHSSRAPDDICS